jgi:hypothetical protein
MILLVCLAVSSSAGPYDNYLKADDIEKVTGLKGVKSMDKNTSVGAGGDLNFTTADGKLILMIQVEDKGQYAGYKKYYFKSDIKGIGEQAMEGASFPKMPSNLIAFTKGGKCVTLATFVDMASGGKKHMLTISQMTTLAITVASRMQ